MHGGSGASEVMCRNVIHVGGNRRRGSEVMCRNVTRVGVNRRRGSEVMCRNVTRVSGNRRKGMNGAVKGGEVGGRGSDRKEKNI